ncbi:MAG: carboxy terminal-processing peptidase [Bacteriovoracaceae bacterium]|jgi:carboxyl-terminal processing protease|nr:carboxy terminal-processing peptidase [Bacteriovoracaceae bacterium]
MIQKLKSFFVIFFIFSAQVALAKGTNYRDLFLGQIIKNRLELLHISQKKIDDELSQKSFKVFLEKFDFGKQYFLVSDIDKIKKYEFKIDDAIKSGNFEIVKETSEIYFKRVKQIQAFAKEILKKPFDFSKKETLETDPEKRQFLRSEKELKDLWRKTLKLSALSRYVAFEEEENGTGKKDPKKKKAKAKKPVKKKKKLTHKQLEKKAREGVEKSYTAIFSRLLQEERDDQLEKFFNAVTSIFDPHTTYMPPQKKEDFDIDMSGKLEGIGALLREDGPYIKVVRIIPGSASWRQKGLKAEDVILKVGQGEGEAVDIVNMRVGDAVKKIRGEKGTEVRLTVKKPDGSIAVIPIIRDVVQVEESYAKGVNIKLPKAVDYKVGYINLPKFYRDFQAVGSDKEIKNCTEDVRVELERLKKTGAKGMILDLRNNGGGALEDAKKMSGLFIKKGPIVQVKGHDGSINVLADDDPSVTWTGPTIILTNRFSASASEILAAALKDYNRAVIVGTEYTHGKGTVQAVVSLDQGLNPFMKKLDPMGALKVTIQKFYRINGSSTQYKGVTPDIILPDPYDYVESGEQFLDYSLPWSKVNALSYNKWQPENKKLPSLLKKSQKRIKTNKNFKKIVDKVKILKTRRERTKQELSLRDFKQKIKLQKKQLDGFEIKKLNYSMLFSDYSKNKKKLDEVGKEERKTFEEGLSKDPFLEESLLIINDMIKG